MNPQQIAYDYINAHQVQRCYEDKVNQALQLLNPDNQIFGLCDSLSTAYDKLVLSTLGEDTFEWLLWWMYECDYGRDPKSFTINHVEYSDVTQLQFTHIITQ